MNNRVVKIETNLGNMYLENTYSIITIKAKTNVT